MSGPASGSPDGGKLSDSSLARYVLKYLAYYNLDELPEEELQRDIGYLQAIIGEVRRQTQQSLQREADQLREWLEASLKKLDEVAARVLWTGPSREENLKITLKESDRLISEIRSKMEKAGG
jgi:hypothetical protein